MTLWRAKPAVPFGGKFRIIDFPLSNCMNSRHPPHRPYSPSTSRIHSSSHIQRGWGFLRGEFGEFVELLPGAAAYRPLLYAGTADAIHQNLDIIRNTNRPIFWSWPAITFIKWITAR